MDGRKVKWLVAWLMCLALWPVSAVADVAAWQRHSDAAVDAFVKSDTAEAEKKFKAAITEAKGLNPDSPQLAKSLCGADFPFSKDMSDERLCGVHGILWV